MIRHGADSFGLGPSFSRSMRTRSASWTSRRLSPRVTVAWPKRCSAAVRRQDSTEPGGLQAVSQHQEMAFLSPFTSYPPVMVNRPRSVKLTR